MFEITFDRNIEVFLGNFEASLRNFKRLWTDFIGPFTYAETDEIFHTGGRGSWAPLSEPYASQKAAEFPGQTILRREDAYFDAATTATAAGSLFEVSALELEIGVDSDAFEGNYPEAHEGGYGDLPARSVYELIVAGAEFEGQVSQLTEKYTQEEIAMLERGLF